MARKKVKQIAIIGHFGGKETFLDGQTIKTKVLCEELKNVGGLSVKRVDTYYKEHNPAKLLLDLVCAVLTCKHIIILVAANGMKTMFPVLYFCSKYLNKKIYHAVIGASLAQRVENNKNYKKYINSFCVNWCETIGLVNALQALGITNAELLYNCKRLTPLAPEALSECSDRPYKLCMFSRVMREKGVEDAVTAVTAINEKYGQTVYTLDIYGQIDAAQKDWFEEIQKSFPTFIRYCGVVSFDKSVETLKEYFALLFPTRYRTEGVPGTIIDAYAAGVPVIASRWDNFDNIIDDSTGIGYAFEDVEALVETLDRVQADSSCITERGRACLEKYQQFSPDVVIGQMLQKIEQ